MLTGELKKSSFEEVVREHRTAVFHHLLSMLRGDRELAEDLTQETFLRAYRAMDSFEGRCGLRGWLKTIATNLARNEFRRSRPVELSLDDSEQTLPLEIPDEQYSPHTTLEAVETRRTVQQTLGKLSEKLRVVFEMKELQGYTHEETARILGVQPQAVRVRHHRAKRLLYQALAAGLLVALACLGGLWSSPSQLALVAVGSDDLSRDDSMLFTRIHKSVTVGGSQNTVEVEEKSEAWIAPASREGERLVRLESGTLEISETTARISVVTPHALVTPIGTVYRVEVNPELTAVEVTEGKVQAVSPDGRHTIVVPAGYRLEVGEDWEQAVPETSARVPQAESSTPEVKATQRTETGRTARPEAGSSPVIRHTAFSRPRTQLAQPVSSRVPEARRRPVEVEQRENRRSPGKVGPTDQPNARQGVSRTNRTAGQVAQESDRRRARASSSQRPRSRMRSRSSATSNRKRASRAESRRRRRR